MARAEVRRGEVWLVGLGMAQKVRPVVILSVAYLDQERALVTYVPRTTILRDTRFEVAHEARGFNAGASQHWTPKPSRTSRMPCAPGSRSDWENARDAERI